MKLVLVVLLSVVSLVIGGCVEITSDSVDDAREDGLSFNDDARALDFRQVAVEGNMNLGNEEPAQISAFMQQGQFDLGWNVDARGQAYRVELFLSPTDNLDNAGEFASFNCDATQGVIGDGCDAETHVETCTFTQKSVVACGPTNGESVLSRLDTDQLPAQGFIVFKAERPISGELDIASFEVVFN
mgnify:CR=1 FL=1